MSERNREVLATIRTLHSALLGHAGGPLSGIAARIERHTFAHILTQLDAPNSFVA